MPIPLNPSFFHSYNRRSPSTTQMLRQLFLWLLVCVLCAFGMQSASAQPAVAPALTAIAGNTQVTLKWLPVSTATVYDVYQSTDAGSDGSIVTSPVHNPTEISISRTSLTNGTAYYYKVRARNTSGSGPLSSQVSVIPVNPPVVNERLLDDNSVTLKWSAVTTPNLSAYEVLRKLDGTSDPFVVVNTVTAPAVTYTDTGVTTGTRYQYRIRVANPTSNANLMSATIYAQPTKTSAIEAIAGNRQVTIKFDPVADATQYHLFISADPAQIGTYSAANNAPIFNVTLYNSQALVNGIKYYFRMRPYTGWGTPAYSNQVACTPISGPVLSAPILGDNSVGLEWSPVVLNPEAPLGMTVSYEVYRALVSANFTSTPLATTSITTYTDSAAVNNTPYKYKIQAATPTSNTYLASATLNATPMKGVALNTPVPGIGQAALGWAAVDGATTYRVYQSTISGELGTVVANQTATNVNRTGLTNGTTYYFTVQARNATGSGLLSVQRSALPLALPAAVNPVTLTPGDAQITLSFPSIANATSYRIYRSTTSNTYNYSNQTLTATGTGTVSATDTGLTNGTTYYYVVRTVNTSGASASSTQVTGVPIAGPYINPPATPGLPEVVSITSTGVTLKTPALPAYTSSFALQRAVGAVNNWRPVLGGLKVWLDANQLTDASGTVLDTWPDRSGNNNHATQTATRSRPKLVTNQLNGHPVVRLDGAEDGFGDYFNLPSQTQVRTAIIVARHKTGSQDWAPILGSKVHNFHGGAGSYLFHGEYTSALTINGQAYIDGESVDPITALKPTEFQVLTFATTAPAQIDFLSTQEGLEGARSWNGDFAEVLLYDRVLTTQERKDTEAYLINKYELKVATLPTTPVWETVATNLGALTNRVETGLSPDTNYFYRCVAVGPGGQTNGEALLVKTNTVVPATPGVPTLVGTTASSVTLTLPAMPANAYCLQVEYKIHSEDTNGYRFGAVSTSGAANITIPVLNPVTQYDFRLVAIGNGGRSIGLPLTASTTGRGTGTGLTGAYYKTANFENAPSHIRVDPTVNFNWLEGSPLPGTIPLDFFSVRWRGQIEPLYSERYKFRLSGKDAFRLRINGTTLIDLWAWAGYGEHVGEITLEKGQKYDIVVEYMDKGGHASAKLEWESTSQKREVVPQDVLYPILSGTGLTAEYFDDANFTDFFMKRVDPEVNYQWWSSAPAIGMGSDSFSLRWLGKVQPVYSETYTFTLDADNEATLWIDNQLIATATGGANTGIFTLTAGQKYDIKIEYKEVSEDAHVRLYWESASQMKEIVPHTSLFPTTVTMPAASDGNGLRARYYRNRNFVSTDLMMNRVDPKIDFNWRSGAPSADLQPHNFSVRWEGEVQPLFTEKYQFIVDSRDKCRVWVNGTQIIDRWNTDVLSEPYGDIDGSIDLVAGQKYTLKVEYSDAANGDGQARIKLLWTSASQFLETIPQSQLFTPIDDVKLGSGTGLLASYFLNQPRNHVKVTINPPPATCPESLSWELDEFPNQFNRKVDSYVVPEVNFDWGYNTPWGGGDDFTARWAGEIEPLYSETYTFKTETDDGVRLWVNGELLIDDWIIGGARNHEETITLDANERYSIVMEMFDARFGQTGEVANSKAKLYWSSARQGLEIIPQRQLYPAAPEVIGYGTGLRGHYYSNTDHTELEGVQLDDDIDFDWSAAVPFSMNRNTFAVRWVGYIASNYTDQYRFIANTDDQVKVWIGGQPIIDNEKNPNAKFGEIRMVGGVRTPIVIEFVQSEGEAHFSLEWESQHQEKEVVPTEQLYIEPDLQMQAVYPTCMEANVCAPCPSLPDIYDGHVTKINVPSKVKAGETFTVKVWYKNTGQKPWVPGFGTDKVYGLSDQGFLWGREGIDLDRAQTLILDTPYVPPGEVGEFNGTMHAPTTTGTYDASWAILVNGGRFAWSQNLRIQVLPAVGSDALAAPRILKTSDTSTTLKIPSLTTHSNGVTLQRAKQSTLDAPVNTGLKMWLKADDLSAVETGESLPQWTDLSGQARHATQTVAGLRPVKRNDAVNGRPAVRFDGKDDYMEFPVTNDIRSVFIVVKDRETNKNKGSILGNRQYGGEERFVAGGTTHMFTVWDGPALENGVGGVNGYVTAPLQIKKSAYFQVISIETTSASSAAILAHGFNSIISPWDGDIAELLIYDSVLSAGDKRSVEAYLTAKYGRPTAYEPVSPTWTTIGTTFNGGEEYVDSGLDANSTYWYRCVPIEGGAGPGKSAHTTTLSEVALPDAPDAPTFSEVSATSVKVQAPELPAAADYLTLQVKEEEAPVGAYTNVDQKIVPEGFVVVNKLNPLTEYSFRYVVINVTGQTAGTEATVTTLEPAPDVPDAPSIQSVGQSDATLKMPALPLRADSLKLQMSPSGVESYVTVDGDIDPAETYHATGLSIGQSYLFRCIAVNETGETTGLVAAITTDLPLPGAPKRPKFSALTDTSVDITAPALPDYAISLSLQTKAAAAPNTAFTTIATGLAANSIWTCTNLQPGLDLEFRYLAVNWTGSTAGQVGGLTPPLPEVTWSAGAGIDCLGIRFPESSQSVEGGTVVNLDSYLATDFDMKRVVAGASTRITNHSDTCAYTWTALSGTFVGGVNTGQKVQWTAPTTPSTYIVGLTVDDQGGANKKTTEGGNRTDASDGYNDAPQKYQVTITVKP